MNKKTSFLFSFFFLLSIKSFCMESQVDVLPKKLFNFSHWLEDFISGDISGAKAVRNCAQWGCAVLCCPVVAGCILCGPKQCKHFIALSVKLELEKKLSEV